MPWLSAIATQLELFFCWLARELLRRRLYTQFERNSSAQKYIIISALETQFSSGQNWSHKFIVYNVSPTAREMNYETIISHGQPRLIASWRSRSILSQPTSLSEIVSLFCVELNRLPRTTPFKMTESSRPKRSGAVRTYFESEESSLVSAPETLPPVKKMTVDKRDWNGFVEVESEPVRTLLPNEIKAWLLDLIYFQSFFNVMLRDFGVSGVKVQEVISLDEESLNCLPYVDFFDFAPCNLLL